jgi:hypothetical protein
MWTGFDVACCFCLVHTLFLFCFFFFAQRLESHDLVHGSTVVGDKEHLLQKICRALQHEGLDERKLVSSLINFFFFFGWENRAFR